MTKQRGALALSIVFLLAGVGWGVTQHAPKKAVAVKYAGRYVALGDSVAAGVGLAGDSDSSACDRTNQSYPKLLAAKLNYQVTNLACSGATIPAGILGSQTVNQLPVAPQLQHLFAAPKPQLVTITIGANDAGWTSLLSRCYTAACGSAADEAVLQTSLATLADQLNRLLDQLGMHYNVKPPTILVTGYYQPFPSSYQGACTDLTGIDTTELAWGQHVQTSISDTIQSAVSTHRGLTFVPLDFSGHELCSAAPWVQGLTAAEPYHPTASGQHHIADQIRKRLPANQR